MNKTEFNSCIYSSGYISLILTKLISCFEKNDYSFIDLNCINLNKISFIPEEEKNIIFINKLDVNQVINCTNLLLYDNVCFLAPRKLREKYKNLNSLSDEVVKNYPYLQDFIDYLYNKRISINNEIEFNKELKNYITEYLSEKKEDVLSYKNNIKNEDKLIDRDTLYNAILYIVNKLEDKGIASTNLDIVYNDIDLNGRDTFNMYYALNIDHENVSIKTFSYVNEFYDCDVDFSLYYKSEDISVQRFIFSIINHYTDISKDMKYLTEFFNNLIKLSEENKKISTQDIEMFLADLKNSHKRSRK